MPAVTAMDHFIPSRLTPVEDVVILSPVSNGDVAGRTEGAIPPTFLAVRIFSETFFRKIIVQNAQIVAENLDL